MKVVTSKPGEFEKGDRFVVYVTHKVNEDSHSLGMKLMHGEN